MSDGNLPLFERLLDQAARRLSAAGLHPLQLRDGILEAFEGAVEGGDAPNDLNAALHPDDFRRLRPELAIFRAEMLQALAERSRLAGYRTVGERQLRFVSDQSVSAGTVRVRARFAHQPSAPVVRGPSTATRRLAPVRDLYFRLAGGERVRVTHVPFFIGRGPENDLVLASMAVSRNHAELTRDASGLILRDMGSRNGIMVGGERRNEVAVTPGLQFTIGDVDLSVDPGRPDGR